MPAPKPRDAVAIAGPLGIIAGRGPLPCVLAELAEARGLPLHIVGIRGETREEIERFPHTWTRWGELGKLLAALDDHGCRDIVIIGGVDRPDFTKMRFDFGAIRNLPYIAGLRSGGDDHVLSRVVRFFEGKGYRVHGADDVAPELLAGVGPLGDKVPSAEDSADIDMAFQVVRALGRFDVGQAAVVANGHVLAVEAAEGTDAMLLRCAELRRLGRAGRNGRGVIVKAPKPGQERRVDLPTIGAETLNKAAEAGLAGVAVAAGRVLMAEPAATVAAANKLGLFLVGHTLADDAKGDATKPG